MARRIGFTFGTLQHMDPAASVTDARLVWKEGDSFNIGIVNRDGTFIQGVRICGTRDMRLLGMQLMRHADDLDRSCDDTEVVIP